MQASREMYIRPVRSSSDHQKVITLKPTSITQLKEDLINLSLDWNWETDRE